MIPSHLKVRKEERKLKKRNECLPSEFSSDSVSVEFDDLVGRKFNDVFFLKTSECESLDFDSLSDWGCAHVNLKDFIIKLPSKVCHTSSDRIWLV